MFPQLITAGMALIDKLIPDKQAQADAKLKLLSLQQSGGLKEIEASMNVIVAEAKSEHWITSAWRPITMLVFVAIVANNYILYPYISLFWDSAPILDIPPQLWDLLKIGIGGYVVGRTVEKSVKTFKNND